MGAAQSSETGARPSDDKAATSDRPIAHTTSFAQCLAIVEGTKTRECFVRSGDTANVGVGQRILFGYADSDKTTEVVVTEVAHFPSTATALASASVAEFVPDALDVEAALKLYAFEDEAKYGVTAVRFVRPRALIETHFA
ncbi:MAG: hypothetical protein KGL39_23965 [Patescibacteria group bacterium]|nr:hypothetical protein [Patescibacteria group bacterium]